MTNAAADELPTPPLWPDHLPWPDRLLSLAEWDALDEELIRRAELVEGVLVVSPSPERHHQRHGARLAVALEASLGSTVRVAPDIDVLLDNGPPPTVRRPDVVVVPATVFDEPRRLTGPDVLAVFEILSPGSRRTDRVTKLAEYAEAGIPHYGIVDLDGPTLAEFTLDGGAYRLVAEHRGSAALALGVTVDLDALGATGSP